MAKFVVFTAMSDSAPICINVEFVVSVAPFNSGTPEEFCMIWLHGAKEGFSVAGTLGEVMARMASPPSGSRLRDLIPPTKA